MREDDFDNVDLIPEEQNDGFSNDDLFNITSWGADITLREIVMSYNDGDIVKPELQRKFVWDKAEASRFIESILLGLPVPSIFLSMASDGRQLIVDGYQRITTICDFQNGVWSSDGQICRLVNTNKINARWRGKCFIDLSDEDRRRFKAYSIHAIIFEQKTPQNDSGLYQIFERINTSGKSLNAQEIRNCVYQGKMNTLLLRLNNNEKWRSLFGDKNENARMLDLEFILRFFALSTSSILNCTNNSISLKKTLNDFMSQYVECDDDIIENMAKTFNQCIDFIYDNIGGDAFYNLQGDLSTYRRKFYPTIFDSIMIATKIALKKGAVQPMDLMKRHLMLLKDTDYRESISQGTMQMKNIRMRVGRALEILYNLPFDYEE